MKKSIVPILSALMLLACIGTASANAIQIGIFDGNDPSQEDADLSAFENSISSWYKGYYDTDWGMDWTIEFYTKVDGSSGSQNGLTLSSDPGQGEDKLTGEWQTADAINVFSVKAGNGYALYWLDSAASSGAWTTYGLLNNGGNQPGISHFSAWTLDGGDTPPNTPVPEPGTLVLLGIGLMGILGLSRRRRGF